MPAYRALREKHSFLELCHDPSLITKVTLLPIQEFGFDAAIIFSDILLIAEAFGLSLRFEEGVGPIIDPPVRSHADVAKLKGRSLLPTLSCVLEGIRLFKKESSVPLIGFAGAPFTIASYLIEGGSFSGLKYTTEWVERDPASFQALVDLIADYTAAYINLQIEAGIDAVQLFDSWAHLLQPDIFSRFGAGSIKRVLTQLKTCPVILFCRGPEPYYEILSGLQPAGLSIGWDTSMVALRKSLGQGIALQGNLDPNILLTNTSTVKRETLKLLKSMQGDPRFICNLGHGILPATPVENVHAFVECVHS